jgi:hypothetical protein
MDQWSEMNIPIPINKIIFESNTKSENTTPKQTTQEKVARHYGLPIKKKINFIDLMNDYHKSITNQPWWLEMNDKERKDFENSFIGLSLEDVEKKINKLSGKPD